MFLHTHLPYADWQQLAHDHLLRAQRWTRPAKLRRDRGELHPIQDFIFDYYPFSFGFIESWHPGLGVALEWPEPSHPIPPHLQSKHYQAHNGWIFANPQSLTPADLKRLNWSVELLEATLHRTPNFACHGLHEWAMVYQAIDIRHQKSLKLRLPQSTIDQTVESLPICCTHFDAFRFFAPSAQPLNRCQPTLDHRCANENPACLHANMDLFKWAAKAIPWVDSSFLLQTFELAHQLRLMDMQASPYDLSPWNLPAIEVETSAGRKHYESQQRHFFLAAQPLRDQLLNQLKQTLLTHDSLTHP